MVSYADNPWSGGERELQNVLRAAGLTGWVANVVLRVGGFTYYPDLLFETAMLIVEFDGFAVHGTRQAFESDPDPAESPGARRLPGAAVHLAAPAR